MRRPDTILIDGHAYSWRQLCELRRQQLEAWEAAQPRQPALFAVRHDARPPHERTPTGRYLEPSLLEFARANRSEV